MTNEKPGVRHRTLGHGVRMARLRTVSPNTKGLSRRRAGSGFVYLDKTGARITDVEEIQRIKSTSVIRAPVSPR